MRGGVEYGMGVHVVAMVKDSVAHVAGFNVGDQILAINGTKVEGLKHEDVMKLWLGYDTYNVVVLTQQHND